MFDPIKKAQRELKKAAREERQQQVNNMVRQMRVRVKTSSHHHLWPLFMELAGQAGFQLSADAILDEELRKRIYYYGAKQLHPDTSGDEQAFKKLATINLTLKNLLDKQ